MSDGGWNCQRDRGTTHASMHTSINVLEGLRLYESNRGRQVHAVRAAQQRGRDFLLTHRLFRSHRTAEVIKPIFLHFSFPPRWHYDVLRALDYFRAVDAPGDARVAEAIDVLRGNRGEDGRWRLQNDFRGKRFFALERAVSPSRWNTLRALRVLKWWDGRGGAGSAIALPRDA